MGKLDGKVAVVTGSGRGIGRAIALKLAAEGARVVVNDLDEEPAAEVLQTIRAAGGEAVAVIGSVCDDDFPARLISAAIANWDDIHIIVNNAGFTWDNVIQKMTDEQWDKILEVHLKAPFRILRQALEPIRTRAAAEFKAGTRVVRKVVNISSTSGTGGNAGQSNYSAAKSGVNGLTKALSKEWGRYAVTVNSVAFGFIDTRLTKPMGGEPISIDGATVPIGIQQEKIDSAPAFIPLGHAGSPEEAAGAVYLLCIPESDYVTGQVLVCGGGLGQVA